MLRIFFASNPEIDQSAVWPRFDVALTIAIAIAKLPKIHLSLRFWLKEAAPLMVEPCLGGIEVVAKFSGMDEIARECPKLLTGMEELSMLGHSVGGCPLKANWKSMERIRC